MKMNRKNLLILAGFSLFAVQSAFAGINNKGIEYYRAELYDAAKIFFLQQKGLTPTDQAENYYYLGQTYYQLNKQDSAAYYYQKATEIFPEYPFGYIGLGKMELKKGNAKAAEELFKKANGFAKKDPSIQTTIAEVYIDAGDYTNAAVSLDRARRVNSKFSGIYLAEGDMLAKQGKIGDACSRYDNAILFDNTDKAAYLRLAEVYKTINPNEALKYLDKLTALDPNYIPAYAILGDIYREDRRYMDALAAYEKFIAVPGVPITQYERYAQLLFFTGQFEKATDQIKYVISKDPNNLVMKRLEAYNSFRLENYAEGLKQMQAFLQEMPKERHIYQDYMYLGQLAAKEKQPKLALEAFQKAIDMDTTKTKTDTYKEAANAALSIGMYPEAIQYYEQYIASDPNADAMDYFSYGQICYSAAANYITTPDAVMDETAFKSYVQKGDAAFAEVAKRKPEMYHGYLWRANINALLDKYDADKTGKTQGYAKPLYEEAINVMLKNNSNGERNKDIITSYRYLVSYYYSVNDTNSVIDYSKKILAIDPNDENAQKTLNALKVKY